MTRRRLVVALTLAVGGTLLWLSLSTPPGDPGFYPLTLALAATWVLGALLSGRLQGGRRTDGRRPLLLGAVVGLAAVAVFAVGALAVAQVPALRSSVDAVLDHASHGLFPVVVLVTVVNGVAEELFFRGALYAAVAEHRPVLWSTACYAATTLVTGNPMLVFAATVVGLVAGLLRRETGGVLAPALAHVTWSVGMLLVLPPLLAVPG